MEISQRVRISTGLKCNLKCSFCYYNEELNTQDYSKEEIIEMLEVAWKYNIRDIDFSGGEPTLRKDLPELLSYARDKGFQKMCIITNGTKIADANYLSMLKESGLNEVLISLHGCNAEMHDELVRAKGAFNKIITAIENCVKYGIRLRTNTVVNKRNYDSLKDIAAIIKEFRPAASNFICFNDWINAAPLTKQIAIKYSEAAEYIKQAIDVLNPVVPKVTARYIPFCFMKGYEKHVIEHCPDFISTMTEWFRLVKPGGYIFFITPHRDAAESDRTKPLTEWTHLFEDYKKKADSESEKAAGLFGHCHYHVFSPDTMKKFMGKLFGDRLSLVDFQERDDKGGLGFSYVYKKVKSLTESVPCCFKQ